MSKTLDKISRLQPEYYGYIAKALEKAGFYTIDSNVEIFKNRMGYAYKGGELLITTSRCGTLNVTLANVPAFIEELREIYDLLISRQEMRVKGA